jgi:hypothetical protein
VRYLLHEAMHGHHTERLHALGAGNGIPSFASPALNGGATSSASGPMATAMGLASSADEVEDGDSRIAQVRALIPAAVIKEAEALFKAGLARFRNSATLPVAAARFFSIFCGNAHLQMR